MEQLTVKEALEQGYHLAGCADVHDYQCLQNIEDLTQEDFEEDDYVLAEKDGFSPSIDGQTIYESVVDNIRASEDFHDDTNEIDGIVEKAINFDELAEKINKALEERKYYRLTKIKLLPNPVSGLPAIDREYFK